jgi:hypothetical protein
MDDHFSLVREVRSVLSLVVKVLSSGEPTEGEWNQIRATLFRALRPFDDARRAVREALTELGQMGELAPS